MRPEGKSRRKEPRRVRIQCAQNGDDKSRDAGVLKEVSGAVLELVQASLLWQDPYSSCVVLSAGKAKTALALFLPALITQAVFFLHSKAARLPSRPNSKHDRPPLRYTEPLSKQQRQKQKLEAALKLGVRLADTAMAAEPAIFSI